MLMESLIQNRSLASLECRCVRLQLKFLNDQFQNTKDKLICMIFP